jgi:hypothetical protein
VRADDRADSSVSEAHPPTSADTGQRAARRPDSPGLGVGIALTALGSAALDAALALVAASLMDMLNKVGQQILGCDDSLGEHCDNSTNWFYPGAAVAASVVGIEW